MTKTTGHTKYRMFSRFRPSTEFHDVVIKPKVSRDSLEKYRIVLD
jgi:hypothetical protein